MCIIGKEPIMLNKKCPRCELSFPLTNEFFNTNKTKKDGFQSCCIKCQKAYNASHYRNNLSIYKIRGASSKAILEQRYYEIKSRYSCLICNESDSCCIDFHHVDPTTKSSTIASLKHSSLETLKSEMDKCVPLCANCHRKLHAGRITLPDAGD